MNRNESLADDLASIQVNLACRGLLNGYLPPAQWEPLRLKLQGMYRRATGEEFATLIVQEARDGTE